MAKFTTFASKSPFDGQAVEFRLKSRSKPITGLFRYFPDKKLRYEYYQGSFIDSATGVVYDILPNAFQSPYRACNWRPLKQGVQSNLEYLSVEQLNLFPPPLSLQREKRL
jgi:hypothetical protein